MSPKPTSYSIQVFFFHLVEMKVFKFSTGLNCCGLVEHTGDRIEETLLIVCFRSGAQLLSLEHLPNRAHSRWQYKKMIVSKKFNKKTLRQFDFQNKGINIICSYHFKIG